MKILVCDRDPETVKAVGAVGARCTLRWPHRELLMNEDPDQLMKMIEQ